MRTALRAFVWLRWRVLVNSLERTGARDALDRFSIAIEKLGPLIALVLLIPSSIALAALSLAAGFGLATGSWLLPFEVIRYFVLASTVMALFGPLLLPARMEGNVVRLLLLPVTRAVLYVAHVAGALADPWILLLLPVIVGVPIGLAVGGRVLAAAIAAVAGAGVLLFVTGVTSLVSSIVQLLFRDKRRGEVVMLLLVVVLPLAGMLPSMMQIGGRSKPADGAYASEAGHQRRPPPMFIVFAVRAGHQVAPSELYRRATIAGHEAPARSIPPLVGLLAGALLIQGTAFAAFARMLDVPATQSVRRAGVMGGLWERRIPGLTAGVSAVALTQLRLALRTPRGRSVVAAPMLMVAVFSVLVYRSGETPFRILSTNAGLIMATLGGFISLLSILPLAVNQFAVDRAGFTRQMLSPLGVGELLAGKAVGNLLIMAIPASLAILVPAVLFRDGAAPLWLALPPGLLACFALVAPVAASLSAVFPKTVDLSSIGSGSNAHQAAGLLGLLSFVVSALPAVGIVTLATRLLGRPVLAPILMCGWCFVAIAISWAAFVPVRALVAARAESISQY